MPTSTLNHKEDKLEPNASMRDEDRPSQPKITLLILEKVFYF